MLKNLFFKINFFQILLIYFLFGNIIKSSNAETIIRSLNVENDYLYNFQKLKNKNMRYNYNYACASTKNEFKDEFQYLLKHKYGNPMERSTILVYGFSLANFKYLDKTRILFSSGIYNNTVNFLTTPVSELKYQNSEYKVFDYNLDDNIVIKYSINANATLSFNNLNKLYLFKEVFSLKKKDIDNLKNLKNKINNSENEDIFVELLEQIREYTEINVTSSSIINKNYYVCGLYK
jgi:hypothetical protein